MESITHRLDVYTLRQIEPHWLTVPVVDMPPMNAFEVDIPIPPLLEELLQQPEDQQQLLANMVRHVAVGLFAPHLLWTPSTLDCTWLLTQVRIYIVPSTQIRSDLHW
jgi:hypothetical protein